MILLNMNFATLAKKRPKMWFLWIVSWVAMLIQICLLTLCIAAGLYYLAELVEEYTVMTKRVIKYLIVGVSCVYIGLMVFEGMPWKMTLTGLVSTLLYTTLLPNFPDIDLVSPSFVLTLILVFVNHYFAFGYFSEVSPLVFESNDLNYLKSYGHTGLLV